MKKEKIQAAAPHLAAPAGSNAPQSSAVSSPQSSAPVIERVEPPCWWIGMKTSLQIMFYGKNLSSAALSVREPGIKIGETYPGQSTGYLFADIMISPDSEPGQYTFVLEHEGARAEYVYELLPRSEGSASRGSFTAVDVVYLIMPDRFARGEIPAASAIADAKPESAESAATGEVTGKTSGKKTVDRSGEAAGNTTGERAAGSGLAKTSDPDYPDRGAAAGADSVAEKINRQNHDGRHGGNLAGIMERLDYLSGLGVTTLWITPVQLDNEPKASYHGYACADYYMVDPCLGHNDLYRELVVAAHERGLKVIMDAVPNHCGTAHWWMSDLPFADWIHPGEPYMQSNYRLSTMSDPNVSQLDSKQAVEGWFDRSMPDMCTENPLVLHYFIQAYIWWIEWAGLDGLRVDTFPYNDKHAIAAWTKAILTEYPALNITAECWISYPSIVAYWDGGFANRDGYCSYLPSVMDFPLQEAISQGLAKDSSDWDGGINKVYLTLAQDFVYSDPRTMLIFLDNHDIARFADDMNGNADRVKLGLTMLATMRGIPQITYGTELMFRSKDLKAGDGAARIDFPGGWKSDKKDMFKPSGRSKKKQDVYEHAARLFNWRKHFTVIHTGHTVHFLPTDNTYVYFRRDHSASVMVFINASDKRVRLQWERYGECIELYKYGVDVLTGRKWEIGSRDTVKARTSLVLELYK